MTVSLTKTPYDCICDQPAPEPDEPVQLGSLPAVLIRETGLDPTDVADQLNVTLEDLQAGNLTGATMHRLARLLADAVLGTRRLATP